jgi:hypothetical protein
MSTRQDLASDIAAGLAGWYQLHHIQKLGELAGEDSARFIVAQIVNAQGRYAPATSQLPQNWGSTKKRVDVAIKGRTQGAANWYGAIEIKWPGSAFDAHQIRLLVVQDAMRLAFIETANLNAHFLVLGGSQATFQKLFDAPHPNAPDREDRRVAFGQLLSRDTNQRNGSLTPAVWSQRFAEAGDRLPVTVFDNFDGRLKCELLASAESQVAGNAVGKVYVWQCNRTRGTAQDDEG